MSAVAVLGAGAGGLSATVELCQAGHEITLWNRNPLTLMPFTDGVIPFEGVLGTGTIAPALMTTSLELAVSGVDAIVVCLPSMAHGKVFEDLAALGVAVPIILNPGHTAAALHARAVWSRYGAPLPPLAELSTLTYVARVEAGVVRTTGRAGSVRAGCLPGGGRALEWAQQLFPSARPVRDVLASSLSNVNLVLHPPGSLLGLAWVEATGGDFTFYVQGMTDGVAKVVAALDEERLGVARAYGHELAPLAKEMAAIGTVDPGLADASDVGAAIRGGVANRTLGAPTSTEHRYYREDLPFGLLPFTVLAATAGHPVPVAQSLLTLGRAVLGPQVFEEGLGADRLGLSGLSAEGLLGLVRG